MEPISETLPSASEFNLLSPEVRADPYPYYAALRRDSPVHPLIEGMPFYAITRHQDVLHVVHHPEQFSSTALQMALQGGGIAIGPNSGALAGHRLLESPMMIANDPPDHGRLRRLVNRGFTPRRIADLEPRIRELARAFVAEAAKGDEMDLVRELSVPLPVTVIAEMLGVEPEQRDQFKEWSDAFVVGLSGGAGQYSRDDVQRAADEMADYIERVAEGRRARPAEDLISVLVAAEEGEALSTGDVLSFVALLLIAGNETTTNLIGNGMKALLAHPDQLERVQADASLIPQMVEEVLRYDSPIQGLPRTAATDAELPSGSVPKDAMLLVFFGSANRDDDEFPAAGSFDIGRRAPTHVAFGHGIHFCLGAALARLEARVAFETLFEMCRDFELTTDEVPMVDSLVLRGPKQLPVRFRRV